MFGTLPQSMSDIVAYNSMPGGRRRFCVRRVGNRVGAWRWGLILVLVFLQTPVLTTRAGDSTLRLAVETDPRSLDPAQVFTNEEAMLAYFVFKTLYDLGPDGGLVPSVTCSACAGCATQGSTANYLA